MDGVHLCGHRGRTHGPNLPEDRGRPRGGRIALAASMWLLSMVLLGPGGGLNRIVAATPMLSREEINSILIFGGNTGTSAETLPATTGWWLAILSPYTSTPVTILHTLGIALAALGAVLLLVPLLGGAANPLAAMGSMTLTLYSAHVIVLATEILDEGRPVMSITIQCIVFLLAAVLWRNAVGKGPLESVVAVSTAWLRTLVLNRGAPSASHRTVKPASPDFERPGTADKPVKGGHTARLRIHLFIRPYPR